MQASEGTVSLGTNLTVAHHHLEGTPPNTQMFVTSRTLLPEHDLDNADYSSNPGSPKPRDSLLKNPHASWYHETPEPPCVLKGQDPIRP